MRKNESIEQILLNQISVPNKLLTHYKKLGLNELDVMLILHIHRFLQAYNEFPTPTEIASYLTVSEEKCTEYLRRLLQKNMLEIKELRNESNQLSEAYSLDPLWQALVKIDDEKEKQPEVLNHEGEIFILFEQEFGRPLSPFEIEMITVWLDEDQMTPALIKAALREAVLMAKLNFNYIDRILREWRRKGIRTVEQAREEGKSFRNRQVKKQYETEKRDTDIYFNWLEGE